MKPIEFNEANKQLLKPKGYNEDKLGECRVLPVFVNGEECISLWKLSFIDKIKVILFGKIWLRVLSGDTQPPVELSTNLSVFIK